MVEFILSIQTWPQAFAVFSIAIGFVGFMWAITWGFTR